MLKHHRDGKGLSRKQMVQIPSVEQRTLACGSLHGTVLVVSTSRTGDGSDLQTRLSPVTGICSSPDKRRHDFFFNQSFVAMPFGRQ